jgi:hypothetical protein
MKIKYIKSILVIAIIAAVAWFVIWHLMWMTEIEKKLRTEQSSGPALKIEVKEKRNNSERGKTEKNRTVAEEVPASVQESRTQINQTGKPLHEREKPVDIQAGPGTGLPGGGSIPTSEKDTGKWFEKDIGLGKKEPQVKPEPGVTKTEISDDKTMSVTIKNKANPVMQRNIPQPQPVKMPEVKAVGVTPYPTSTVP